MSLPRAARTYVGLLAGSGLLGFALLGHAPVAIAYDAGEPIRVKWDEGDLGGFTRILAPSGEKMIGTVEYHQRRIGDKLELKRVARYADGSSDEDEVEARVDTTLQAVRGHSVIRNQRGTTTLELTIDVPGGHITGFSGLGKDREAYDEKVELPAGTYWGPLIIMVVRNFDQNSSDDRLVFRTVAPTPKPRVLDMVLAREGQQSFQRPGVKLNAIKYSMKPTVNVLVDPIIQRLAPTTWFFMRPGEPPALVRFEGVRNYAGQQIRLE